MFRLNQTITKRFVGNRLTKISFIFFTVFFISIYANNDKNKKNLEPINTSSTSTNLWYQNSYLTATSSFMMPDPNDIDGDGIANADDLDDDNDGIIDTAEERCDQPNLANSNEGNGTLQDQLYFFDWSGIGGTLNNGDTQTFTVNDLVITATFSNVVINGGGAPAITTSDLNTFESATFGQSLINLLYNTPGSAEALYGNADTQDFSFTVDFVATKNGNPYPLDIIAFDAEATTFGGGAPANQENIIFTTNGGNWTFLESINPNGTTTSTVTQEGQFTVNNQTLTAVEWYCKLF